MATTIAHFQRDGKHPVDRHKLRSQVKKWGIASKILFNRAALISLKPEAFVMSIA